jgi:hypothetical protein
MEELELISVPEIFDIQVAKVATLMMVGAVEFFSQP